MDGFCHLKLSCSPMWLIMSLHHEVFGITETVAQLNQTLDKTLDFFMETSGLRSVYCFLKVASHPSGNPSLPPLQSAVIHLGLVLGQLR